MPCLAGPFDIYGGSILRIVELGRSFFLPLGLLLNPTVKKFPTSASHQKDGDRLPCACPVHCLDLCRTLVMPLPFPTISGDFSRIRFEPVIFSFPPTFSLLIRLLHVQLTKTMIPYLKKPLLRRYFVPTATLISEEQPYYLLKQDRLCFGTGGLNECVERMATQDSIYCSLHFWKEGRMLWSEK